MLFRKVLESDIAETDLLFRECLTELIAREGINEEGLLEDEILRLRDTIQKSFREPHCHFYLAEDTGRILGTIALDAPGPLISSNIELNPDLYEISCVYIHPKFQRQGVGGFLFSKIQEVLRRMGCKEYYLDAGFSSSQEYWLKKLGEATFVLKDYWSEGQPHRIWKGKI